MVLIMVGWASKRSAGVGFGDVCSLDRSSGHGHESGEISGTDLWMYNKSKPSNIIRILSELKSEGNHV